MPLYEYKCRKCGSVVEIIQRVNDRPLNKCSQCGGLLTKLLSSPSIQFKGTGWYVTDYARKEKSPDTKGAENEPKEQKPRDQKDSTEKQSQPSSHANEST